MKGYRRVEFQNHQRPLGLFSKEAVPVCVEVFDSSEPLTTFEHPCHRFVHIPAHFCLNLGAAVNVVLAHRLMSRQIAGKEPILPLREMLHEVRGRVPTPVMDEVGWDGKKT